MFFFPLRAIAFSLTLFILLRTPPTDPAARQAPVAAADKKKQGAPPSDPPANSAPAPAQAPAPADASAKLAAVTQAAQKLQVVSGQAQMLTERAKVLTAKIKAIIESPKTATQSTLDDLQSLPGLVQSVASALGAKTTKGALDATFTDLMAFLDKAPKDNSQTPAKTLEDACAALKTPTELPADTPGLSDAQTTCSKERKDAADSLAALSTAREDLKASLNGIYPYVATQIGALNAKLDSLSKLGRTAGTDEILDTLPGNLPVLKEVIASEKDYQVAWKPTGSALASLQVAAPTPKSGDAATKAGAPALAGAATATAAPAATPASTPAAGASEKDTATIAFETLDAKVKPIVLQLDGWFITVAKTLQDSASTIQGKIVNVQVDPADNSAAALTAGKDLVDTIAAAQTTVDAWPLLEPHLTNLIFDGASIKSVLRGMRKDFENLALQLQTLRASVSRLNDAIAGDFEKFDTDQVSLYYFTDVRRLMHALNESTREEGGVTDAKAQADAQRTTLIKAELDRADAQATVNRDGKEVLDLQEQQRQSQSTLKNLGSTVSRMASRLKNAQSAKTSADADLQTAQNKEQNSQGRQGVKDPTLATDVARAQKKQETANVKLTQSQSAYDSAKTESDNAQKQQQDTQTQSDGLPARLSKAQQDLSDAQAAVSKARRDSLVAAQAESDAFAFARDNTPFLYAPADGASTDPVKRVIMYAFNDSKTIFLRGRPDDLSVVRHIIADFDRPVPQARLTLWTFELSADAERKKSPAAANKLNASMEIVDQELGNTRALVNSTLGLLKNLINERVRNIESQQLPECAGCEPPDKLKLRRLAFFNSEVLTQLGFESSLNIRTKDWKDKNLKLLRGLIPDPAGTTTLGEALMILNLATPEIKDQIHTKFENQVRQRANALRLHRGRWDQKSEVTDRLVFDDSCPNVDLLPLTWHSVGYWRLYSKDLESVKCLAPTYKKHKASAKQNDLIAIQLAEEPKANKAAESSETELRSTEGSDSGRSNLKGLTATQLEIARALKTAYEASQLHQVVNQLESWSAEMDSLEAREQQAKNKLGALLTNRRISLTVSDQQLLFELNLKDGCPLTITDTTRRGDFDCIHWRNFAVEAFDAKASISDRFEIARDASEIQDLRARAITILSQMAATSCSPPAAGPGKPVGEPGPICAVLRQLSVPTLMESQQLSMGNIERVKLQLLDSPKLTGATARVAAADEMLKGMVIAIEDDLDRLYHQPMMERLRTRLVTEGGVRVGIFQRESVLASNRQVARVDPRASAQLAVGDTEDILSSVQQLAQLYGTVQSGGALAALGALQGLPREPQPEIYALSTGNKFQVTPVFDPSGQALRFKFDFVSTTNLQEPNGTTNPTMPRIERHTVNTEVQLSNFETREISRFETNAKLGLPTTYSGGVPVLKDIPGVRPWVPLIGWFVRKSGSNSVAQQSVIFGQTTMYPTIGDIVKLLSDPQSYKPLD